MTPYAQNGTVVDDIKTTEYPYRKKCVNLTPTSHNIEKSFPGEL